ncbi:hypothetical protein wTpre_638 [Wolbachia endosymbiont of Trichogramma pretiosum]|nr:hypothetical protein wTpre_638 [Wolbachia endosymbiont of Trichogramma pretiosum]
MRVNDMHNSEFKHNGPPINKKDSEKCIQLRPKYSKNIF